MAKSKGLRKQEAMDRQAEYDSLSLQQKLERAQARRGESKKEVARIMRAMKG